MDTNEKNDIIIAIVIPYYKITFFKKTLESLVNQTDKRFKVYIGDDNSDSSPLSLLSNYVDKLDFNYFKFEENLGAISLVKQWDRCIAKTQNEKWIMLLCDDDYISENHIEEFYKNIKEVEELNIKVIRYATCVHEANGEFSKLYNHPKVENSTDFFYRKFFQKSMGSLSEHIFKKNAYLKHGFRDFPLAWGSDDFAWLDFTEFGKVFAINDSTVFFRISSENISRSGYKEDVKKETKLLHFNLIVEKHLKRFKTEQRIPLLLYYEQLLYDSDKISLPLWMKLCKYFISEHSFVQAVKFTRRLLIYNKKK